uniref:ECR1_N domain-containing protein n=1 Tax=Mesocestoides corti TaxID=53468 RepID=A0A5K3EFY4_MESCO
MVEHDLSHGYVADVTVEDTAIVAPGRLIRMIAASSVASVATMHTTVVVADRPDAPGRGTLALRAADRKNYDQTHCRRL